MKKVVTSALLAVACCVQAQVVQVDLVTQQEEYLPNEDLMVGVRIANKSGRKLHFGRDNVWLSFQVEALDGKHVGVMKDPEVTGPFVIDSPMRAVRPFNIAPWFDMTRSGRYFVTATVHIREPGWSESLASNPLTVDIVRGTTVWQQEFGVVGSAPGSAPEIRKYVLQKANLMNNRMKMYVRVTSADESKVHRVIPIDLMMNFSRKEARLDKYNNLHVLLQTPRAIARDYNYSVFGADGRLIIRQTHNADFSRPELVSDSDGLVRVKGGQRRYVASDVPKLESKPAQTPSEGKPPTVVPPPPAPGQGKGETGKLTLKSADGGSGD